MLCSICIATYHRPKGLKRLLDSLLTQALPQGVAVELVVVDNDPAGSAAPVLAQYRQARFPLRTAVEPEPGFSAARNRCVQLAQGDYLAFIDDDEIACDNWLAALFEAMRRYQADGVFGRGIDEFEDPKAAWMGKLHGAGRKTGDNVPFGNDGNCLINAALLRASPAPFNPRFGQIGGQDISLFGRLYQQGHRMVYCHEAAMIHVIPAIRTAYPALVKRHFLNGCSRCLTYLGLTDRPHRRRFTLAGLALGVVPVALGLALLHIGSKPKRWRYFLMATRHCGRLYALTGRLPPADWRQGYAH